MFFLVNAPSDLRKIKACLDDRIIAVCVFALSKGDFDAPDILSGLFRVDCGTINTEEAGTLVFSGVPAFFVTIVLLVQCSVKQKFIVVQPMKTSL